MKILITTGIYPPDIGGPATYVSKISGELIRRGHEVEVITYSDSKIEDDNKYGVYRVRRSRNIFWRYFKYFIEVLKRGGWADVVYVQDPVSAGLPTVLANIFRRKRIILKVVGDFAWEQAQNRYGLRDDLDTFQHQKYAAKIEFWRRVEHFVAQKAKAVITPSEYLKRIVNCWNVADDKIKVIYNSFDEPDAVEEVEMPAGDIIFTAGRLVPWKGIDTLIKLMPELLKINKDFKLMVVGDGPEKKNLDNLINELDLGKSVLLMGRQPREKLLGYLKKSKIFVLNSSYEGLSHQILEAMWSGTPAAVSRVGGNPELIEDGQNGLLFEYNNSKEIISAILKLYREQETAERLAAEAKKSLDGFSFERMIGQTINILKK